MKAKWGSGACVGLDGKVRLTGKIVDDCTRVEAKLKAKKHKRPFEAVRSECGDGTVDEGGGEQCEPPGTAACDVDCLLISSATTSTTPAGGATTTTMPQVGPLPVVSFSARPSSGDAPLTVTFDASATYDPDGSITAHEWDFGDGDGDSGVLVIHTYDLPGSHTARLTVTDDDGNVATTTAVIMVTGEPVGSGPAVRLVVDPPVGLGPLTVTFTADAANPDGDPLTYLWDFGDGEVRAGAAVERHTYAGADSYRATVTARSVRGGGRGFATVDVGSDAATMLLDSSGGTLRLGRFMLAIVPDFVANPMPISVVELPTQAGEVSEQLDSDRFRPIGPAFHFDAPLVSTGGLTLSLSYAVAEIPTGFEARNLALLARIDGALVDPPGRPLPSVFTLEPATVDEVGHTVQASIHGRGVFQVVALPAPLRVLSGNTATGALARGRVVGSLHRPTGLAPPQPPLAYEIVLLDAPPDFDEDEFGLAVVLGLRRARETLVARRGFSAPGDLVSVKVQPLSFVGGLVNSHRPLDILLDPRLPLDSVPPVTAHEYFHVIQDWHSNPASSTWDNFWFVEGTAEWAADEAFDADAGSYSAPTGERLTYQLNRVKENDKDIKPYETVAFWKWLETVAPGSIRAMLVDHLGKTQLLRSISSEGETREKNARHDSLLRALREAVDPDFFEFAVAALYDKDFDADETGRGDLFDPTKLGPGMTVPAYFRAAQARRLHQLREGAPGDGEDDPLLVNRVVRESLSADLQILKSAEMGGLTGTLVVEVPPGANEQVAVIAQATKTTTLLRDLSGRDPRKVEIPIAPGDEVYVITTRSKLVEPGTGGLTDTYRVWVEPCGESLDSPGGDLLVRTMDELVAALENPGGATTIRLAPGSYVAPLDRLWPGGELASLVIPDGITLEGSGVTLITVAGQVDEGGAVGARILVRGRVTLRNLAFHLFDFARIDADGVQRLSLCNVNLQAFYTDLVAGQLALWLRNNTAAGQLLEVMGGQFVCVGPDLLDGVCRSGNNGITAQPAQDLRIRIRGTPFSGWSPTALTYHTGGDCSGQTSVDADCSDFDLVRAGQEAIRECGPLQLPTGCHSGLCRDICGTTTTTIPAG